MCRVYLIRHCHPDIPEGVRMCLGRTDLPLSPKGHRQAAMLAERLRQTPLQQVFTSHLLRSMETAQYLTDQPMVLPGLEELDAGEWDGLTFDVIQTRYPALYEARGTDPTLPLPGSEPDEEGLRRFLPAMERAAALANGDFAVVSHGGIISVFLQSLGMTRYKPAYGEVIPLQYKNGHFQMASHNELQGGTSYESYV